MANWQTVDSYNIKAYFSYFGNTSYPQYLGLQYDLDRSGPTSTVIRFIYKKTNTNGPIDVYYILLNPTTDSRTLIGLKTWYGQDKNRWPCCSDEVTLTKSYSASSFTVPALWICCDGYGTNTTKTAAAYYEQYKDGGNRSSLKSTSANAAVSLSINSSVTVATNGSAPSISITDNKDNTVTFSGNLGTNGTNNAMQSAGIYYTTDGTDPTESNTRKYITLTPVSGASYEKTIQIYKTCTVEAYAVCAYEYNTASCNTEEIDQVTYYKALNDPGKPELLPSSFKNGRLVLKQDWEWHWEKATQVGNVVKDTADRLRFFVKKAGTDSFVNTRMRDPSSGNFLDKAVEIEPGKGDWIFDRDPDAGAMVMKPNQYGLKPGDQVQLAVTSIAKDGNDKLIYSNRMYSDVHTVLNAGVVQVRVDNEWKEGQVMVYVNSEWKEAESVNVNVDGVWKEAQ